MSTVTCEFGGTVTCDDFEGATLAAACGGVTTIVDYCLQAPGQSLAAALERWHAKGAGTAAIDYGFHMAVTDLNAAAMAELPAVADAGVTSIKCFMAYKGVFQIDDATLFLLLEQARELGCLVNVHAENGDVVDVLIKRYVGRACSARGTMPRADRRRWRARPPAVPSPWPSWPAPPSTSCT